MTTTHFRSDKPPSLEEAQRLVGGYVQLLELHDGSQMLVDEDGIGKRLPVNDSASQRYGGVILGDVLVLIGDARWLPEEE